MKKNDGINYSLPVPGDVLQDCLIFLKNVAFLSQLLLDRLLVAAGLLRLLVREEYVQSFLKRKRQHV